jgi:hypothetical protein
MRLLNSSGDYRDFPVPELNYWNRYGYEYDCVVGPCIPESWTASLPFTLTVDYFNQVAECNEGNNNNRQSVPPVTPTVCTTNTPGTVTPTGTSSVTSTATARPCTVPFSDVAPADYFYEAVRWLYCRGAISGYADGTFRPGNNVTRAQICKLVVEALGIPHYTPPSPTFLDVPADHPFYVYIESYWHYAGSCWTECFYFHPYNNTTRGQLAKIIVFASCWPIYTPPTPTFLDVPATDPFYQAIETAYHQGVISGYADGTFRPSNLITRGQVSKIVYRAIMRGASCPSPTPTRTPTASSRAGMGANGGSGIAGRSWQELGRVDPALWGTAGAPAE